METNAYKTPERREKRRRKKKKKKNSLKVDGWCRRPTFYLCYAQLCAAPPVDLIRRTSEDVDRWSGHVHRLVASRDRRTGQADSPRPRHGVRLQTSFCGTGPCLRVLQSHTAGVVQWTRVIQHLPHLFPRHKRRVRSVDGFLVVTAHSHESFLCETHKLRHRK